MKPGIAKPSSRTGAIWSYDRSMAVPYGKRPPSPFTPVLKLFFISILAFFLALLIRTFLFAPFSIPSESMLPRLLTGDYLIVSKWGYGKPDGYLGRAFASNSNESIPQRGDIAVFKQPGDAKQNVVKRVIGLPGDTVQVRSGMLWLNGKPLPRASISDFWTPVTQSMRIAAKEHNNPNSCFLPDYEKLDADGTHSCRYPQYAETLPGGLTYPIIDLIDGLDLDDTPIFRVPKGHLFMMGDNRDRSADSRLSVGSENGLGYVPVRNLVGKASFVIFSVDGSARFWNPVSWFRAVRWDRIGRTLK